MEKAILLTCDLRSAHHEKTRKENEQKAASELNEYLSTGWTVKLISQLSGTDTSFASAVVLLEKSGSV